jgi:ATP-dependent DNA helicase PIF1
MTDQQREEINRKQREYRAQRKVAMQNINKGRRLIGKNVGIYLPEPVFSHGQLYVALSRGVSRSATRVLAKPKVDLDPTGKSTKNIVYRDVLNW